LAGEEVDLPLFFFIDKDFLEDPLMRDVDDIVLSYTFFKCVFLSVYSVAWLIICLQSKEKPAW